MNLSLTQEALTGALSIVSVAASAVAIHLRASSAAQRKALRQLRDRDIVWALYTHKLREFIALKGFVPPEYPNDLIGDFDTDSPK